MCFIDKLLFKVPLCSSHAKFLFLGNRPDVHSVFRADTQFPLMLMGKILLLQGKKRPIRHLEHNFRCPDLLEQWEQVELML